MDGGETLLSAGDARFLLFRGDRREVTLTQVIVLLCLNTNSGRFGDGEVGTDEIFSCFKCPLNVSFIRSSDSISLLWLCIMGKRRH